MIRTDDDGTGRGRSSRRRPRVRAALRALPAPHRGVRPRHGRRPRPRRGPHPGRLRLRAAPHARDRPADRLQAVDLRDRQERLHRPVPPLAAHRGGLLRRRRRPRAPSSRAPPAPAARPDAAVDAKQQLDDLCGAFGGLSDTHHEILVLRELEGLSYREIGERLGLSRPSVESTLFRARQRLTEEYERARLRRALPRGAVDARRRRPALGARDERRLAAPRRPLPALPPPGASPPASTPAQLPRRRRSPRRRPALPPRPRCLPIPALPAPAQSVATVAEPAAGWAKAAGRPPP